MPSSCPQAEVPEVRALGVKQGMNLAWVCFETKEAISL